MAMSDVKPSKRPRYYRRAKKRRSKFDRERVRIAAVEVLRVMKRSYSYEELSSMTGLPVTVLSRYVNGHVLPSFDRASEILDLFGEKFLVKAVKDKIRLDERRVFDHTGVLSDVVLLSMVAKIALREFWEEEITKVLTKETAGIPLAVLVGRELGVDVLIARDKKSMAVKRFIEARRVFSDGTYAYMYLPRGLMGEKDNVLIVDDCIRTGSAVRALAEMCKMAKASLKGVFVIIEVGDASSRIEAELAKMFPPKCPVKALVKLPLPPPST